MAAVWGGGGGRGVITMEPGDRVGILFCQLGHANGNVRAGWKMNESDVSNGAPLAQTFDQLSSVYSRLFFPPLFICSQEFDGDL